MNVVRLMGGLGNQLFEYAFGRVQKENGIDVCYENSWYTTKKRRAYPRLYRLDKFNTTVRFSPYQKQRMIKQIPGCNLELLKMKNCNFDGYWQFLPYYKDHLDIFRKEFVVRPEFLTPEFHRISDEIKSGKSVSLHVRRGDYLTHSGPFRNLQTQYFFEAIKETTGDLFVFSDDIPWCKDKFKNDYFDRQIIFVDLEDFLCFELMKLCETHIISNSTFSWWAAILSGNKTYYPKHWLGDKEIDENELHYPKEWIRMEDYVIHDV